MPFSPEEVEEIGASLGVEWDAMDFTPEDLVEGMEVELEHGTTSPATDITGDDPTETAQIALVHLLERPDYYKRLEEIEKEEMPRTSYMRPLSPSGTAPSKTISNELQQHVDTYLQGIQAAVDKGGSANEAFKKRPTLGRLGAEDLLKLLQGNQHVGRRMLKGLKGLTDYHDVFEVIQLAFEQAVWEAAVQAWARRDKETVVLKKSTILHYKGRHYRATA